MRRWGCSSWHACARGWCSQVVLTGWQAACYARATTRRAARAVARGATIVSGSCRLCLCISDCSCVGKRVRKANGSAHRRCRSQANARGWRLGWRCPSRRRPSSRAYLQGLGLAYKGDAEHGAWREWRRGGKQQKGKKTRAGPGRTSPAPVDPSPAVALSLRSHGPLSRAGHCNNPVCYSRTHGRWPPHVPHHSAFSVLPEAALR